MAYTDEFIAFTKELLHLLGEEHYITPPKFLQLTDKISEQAKILFAEIYRGINPTNLSAEQIKSIDASLHQLITDWPAFPAPHSKAQPADKERGNLFFAIREAFAALGDAFDIEKHFAENAENLVGSLPEAKQKRMAMHALFTRLKGQSEWISPAALSLNQSMNKNTAACGNNLFRNFLANIALHISWTGNMHRLSPPDLTKTLTDEFLAEFVTGLARMARGKFLNNPPAKAPQAQKDFFVLVSKAAETIGPDFLQKFVDGDRSRVSANNFLDNSRFNRLLNEDNAMERYDYADKLLKGSVFPLDLAAFKKWMIDKSASKGLSGILPSHHVLYCAAVCAAGHSVDSIIQDRELEQSVPELLPDVKDRCDIALAQKLDGRSLPTTETVRSIAEALSPWLIGQPYKPAQNYAPRTEPSYPGC